MQEEYGDQGLTVLAITPEGEKLTEDWIEDKGARYAYAYDKSGKLMRELGQSGFPSAALVDPGGRVIWTGHPASIRGRQVEEAIRGAIPTPLWEWPDSASDVRKALQKSKLAKALEAAADMEEDGERYTQIVRDLIDARLQGLIEAFEMGDFLTAVETADELEDAFDDLPEAEKVEEIQDKIDDHPDAKDIIKAQEDVAELAAEADELGQHDRDDAEELIEELREIQQDHPGTYAAKQAGDLADRVRKMMSRMR